jgi:hypothetical protein
MPALFTAAVCALGALASASASAPPSSYSYEAYSNFDNVVDIEMRMEGTGWSSFVVVDKDSQADFASLQAAGLMVVVKYDVPGGDDAQVSLYSTPIDYEPFVHPVSTLAMPDNSVAELVVHFANSTFVSATLNAELTAAENSTNVLFFTAAGTAFDGAFPMLPDGIASLWTDADVTFGRSPDTVDFVPTNAPTEFVPTYAPTTSNFTSTFRPTSNMTVTSEPTVSVTIINVGSPTDAPTESPTLKPTLTPTLTPTATPAPTPTTTPAPTKTSAASFMSVGLVAALVAGAVQVSML